MLRRQSPSGFAFLLRQALPVGSIACAALMAGCSADISRLDSPKYGLGERPPVPSEPIGRRNAGGPPAFDNAGWGQSGPRGATPTPTSTPPSSGRVERIASLPDATAPVNPSVPFDAPRKPKVVTAAPSPANSVGAPVIPGATIDVQPGDTLYGLSHKHHVSIAALMELNGLKNANLRPGQKLVLPHSARRPATHEAKVPAAAAVGQGQTEVRPAGGSSEAVPARSEASHQPSPAGARAADTSTVAAPVAAASDGNWNGTYVIKAGDSLYAIAHRHKLKVADLQRENNITDARKMKPGMTLKVPADGAAETAPSPRLQAASTAEPKSVPASTEDAAPSSTGGVRLLNPPADVVQKKEAAVPEPVKVAGPATAATTASSGTKFRWPARGAVLASFGQRPDGAHNDGINISVPKGSDIAAAAAGTVAYAGSEIKAYGNLILIRHDGGWVTAYAHAEKILVKRGDTVTRGQVIAKAGTSGSVDQPQVHFEIRQGSKPIDPMPHMEK